MFPVGYELNSYILIYYASGSPPGLNYSKLNFIVVKDTDIIFSKLYFHIKSENKKSRDPSLKPLLLIILMSSLFFSSEISLSINFILSACLSLSVPFRL
jgi:hypothetical protein